MRLARVHKLLLKSCLVGIIIGWAILAAILLLDLGGFGEKVLGSSDAVLATFLLAVGFAITFGNAAMGYAIMNLHKSKDGASPKAE